MAKAKFESKKWSSALQHADAALNCITLLREKGELGGIQTQEYTLLPAISPESGKLPTSIAFNRTYFDLSLALQTGRTVLFIVIGRSVL